MPDLCVLLLKKESFTPIKLPGSSVQVKRWFVPLVL